MKQLAFLSSTILFLIKCIPPFAIFFLSSRVHCGSTLHCFPISAEEIACVCQPPTPTHTLFVCAEEAQGRLWLVAFREIITKH